MSTPTTQTNSQVLWDPTFLCWDKPDYPDAAYCTIAPDWVCEVLSPSTRRIDLGDKREIYAREGVRNLWFVEPNAKTLETFELREGQWVLLATLADDDPVSLPPFDAITFPLDALWPDAPASSDPGEPGNGTTDDVAGNKVEPT